MTRSKIFTILGALVLPALTAAGAAAQVQSLCVYGVSQDLCTDRTTFDLGQPTQCGKPGTPGFCQTFRGSLNVTGPLQTDAVGACDEAPELKGATLTLNGTLVLRQQTPEPQRGAWTGTFTITGPVAAKGNLYATVGVGTHRLACLEKCGRDCEKCYDAIFNPTTKTWTIHSEGILDGTYTSQTHRSCTLRWSYAGAFTAPGTATAPASGPWKFCGAIDGVLECPCSQQP